MARLEILLQLTPASQKLQPEMNCAPDNAIQNRFARFQSTGIAQGKGEPTPSRIAIFKVANGAVYKDAP